VRERPGTTVGEAAQAMGIGPSYLYRIAATLSRDGTLRADGTWLGEPVAAAPEQPVQDAPTGVAISPSESGS
jgi:hypothetical protein